MSISDHLSGELLGYLVHMLFEKGSLKRSLQMHICCVSIKAFEKLQECIAFFDALSWHKCSYSF